MLLSPRTAELAKGVAPFRSLGLVEVRGRAERVEVFAAEDAVAAESAASEVPAARPNSAASS